MSVKSHRDQASPSVNCAILTVSDTRNKETDKSGQLIQSLLNANGHKVIDYNLLKDEETAIQQCLKQWAKMEEIEAVLINGGTGIAKRDVTFEVVEGLLEKSLPGFGELFRMLSFTEDIGSAALLSRAVAGSMEGKILFSMPGSSGAVRLAMTKLILPELGHIVYELKKES